MRTARRLADRGVATLFVQTSNCRQSSPLHRRAALGRLLESAHGHGMQVVAWYLPGFDDPVRDIALRNRRMLRLSSRLRRLAGARYPLYRLDELRPGDEIRVHRTDGTRARFAVQRLERHPKDDFPTRSVYARTREPTLRLVTCSGEFDSATGHYVDNTIVFAAAE